MVLKFSGDIDELAYPFILKIHRCVILKFSPMNCVRMLAW